MAEVTRSIKISIAIETNKQNSCYDFFDFDDLLAWLDAQGVLDDYLENTKRDETTQEHPS